MVTPGDARLSGNGAAVRAPKRAVCAALGERLVRDLDYARGGGRSGGYVREGGAMTTNGVGCVAGRCGMVRAHTSAGARAVMQGPIA